MWPIVTTNIVVDLIAIAGAAVTGWGVYRGYVPRWVVVFMMTMTTWNALMGLLHALADGAFSWFGLT